MDIPVSKEDAYPPGHVTDLAVVSITADSDNATVQLQWTAPGDDMDTGIGKISTVLY